MSSLPPVPPLGAAVLDQAGQSLGGFLPRLGGAVVLLVVGWFVAWVIGRGVSKALVKLGGNDLAERWKVHDALERIGLERSLCKVAGAAVRITLRAVVVFAALSLLGLQFLSQSLNEAVLFLPKVLVALALLLAGFVLAGWVRERVDRLAYQMDLPVPVGQLAYVVIVVVFGLTAAAQVTLSTQFVALVLTIMLGAAALTIALSFGLGGRDMARALSAGRYVRGAHEVGQTISVGDVRGEVRSIESAATVLRTADGDDVRVPNHLLLEQVVRVHAGGAPDAGA
jgi:small-conductance mechanosensitive channel